MMENIVCVKKQFNYCHNCAKDNRTCGAFEVYGENCPEWQRRTPTNADRIRSMSDREMASFFADKVINASLNVLGGESEKLTATQIEYEKTNVMYHILQELRTPVKECE